ncbi:MULTISPECIES: cellulose synthase [unclassified Nocardiopsis]|uniref:cellulose synthase n=1 Tax=unclassified Nocardiopsis TaxID=2649073 RepID=UPI0033EE005D
MPETLSENVGVGLGAALTAVGFVISYFVWRRKGAAYGLRGVAWSLLPVIAGLLLLMDVVLQFVLGVLGILLTMAFKLQSWVGIGLAVLMVVLYVVSGFMKSKGIGVKPGARPEDRARARAEGGDASAPAAGAAPAPAGQVGAPKQPKAAAADDDFGDIEALLRKRGID